VSHNVITNWRKSSRSAGDGNCVEIGWTEADWRKSSGSAGGGECVEVGRTDAFVGFRDTKEAHLPADERPMLVFSRAACAAFLAGLGSGFRRG
jgi:hypothetical protein